jgi:hypothetical protein
MRSEQDAMMLVRADLCDRLEALRRQSSAANVAGIRSLAAAYGLTPVVRLADALERAMHSPGGSCQNGLYLDRLRDAIGCERVDERTSEAMLASISVRFG